MADVTDSVELAPLDAANGAREIRVLAEVGRIRYKRGTIRVTIADAGSGPTIDARYWVDARPGYVPRAASKPARPSRPDTPTREGFWLAPDAAERLLDVLAAAIVEAESIIGSIVGEVD